MELLMNISTLMQRDVVTVRAFDELVAAAKVMRQRHVGYLIVTEPDLASGDEKPVGVITDRDIVVTVVAPGENPQALRVGDVMTRQPVTVQETEPVGTALREMRRIGVRRLPIVGTRGELRGVLSLDDVLDSLAGVFDDVKGTMRAGRRTEAALRP